MSGSISETGLTTRRLEALTDGIFAIAMTLLVLTLDLGDMVSGLTNVKLHQLLLAQIPKFYNYALSFVLLAIFWILHHQQFHYIKKTNQRHLWINILILMFVALIPFSTSLVGDYSSDWMAELFFGANIFILGLLFSLNWHYSTKDYRLVEGKLEEHHIRLGTRRGLVTPLVSLLAILMAFVNPSYSPYIYLLIPVILSLPLFRK
ncbi:hypothetical protein AMJ44_06145 [candidate division WOR-1 bacterium DG_54_3]|uniref:DUF1211 domain-containing protein n=1 Tax=candidate division WOR-1 bacterium DG_54_3 TaxID=1703775 RepID=A0A0S7Y1K5_UNCSA|nr:MAG: hypothetical protein AMJ44_06145 [candidate division WOR-1 bacterium DG_54_3]